MQTIVLSGMLVLMAAVLLWVCFRLADEMAEVSLLKEAIERHQKDYDALATRLWDLQSKPLPESMKVWRPVTCAIPSPEYYLLMDKLGKPSTLVTDPRLAENLCAIPEPGGTPSSEK